MSTISKSVAKRPQPKYELNLSVNLRKMGVEPRVMLESYLFGDDIMNTVMEKVNVEIVKHSCEKVQKPYATIHSLLTVSQVCYVGCILPQ